MDGTMSKIKPRRNFRVWALPFKDGVGFRVWAPHAEKVYVTGTFTTGTKPQPAAQRKEWFTGLPKYLKQKQEMNTDT